MAAFAAFAVWAYESPPYAAMPVVARGGDDGLHYPGIRYVQPAVGDRRWRPPVAEPAAAPADTAGWPPVCMQDNGTVEWYGTVARAFGQPPQVEQRMPERSEDCLFLNIWTPDTRARRSGRAGQPRARP